MIPEKYPKSVTIKPNEQSRSPGTGGHVQAEWVVTMVRNTQQGGNPGGQATDLWQRGCAESVFRGVLGLVSVTLGVRP